MASKESIEDEHYILYERGIGLKKISIKDVRDLVRNGQLSGLLTELKKYEVFRIPTCIKAEYKEILANYMVKTRMDPLDVKLISGWNKDEVEGYMRSERLI